MRKILPFVFALLFSSCSIKEPDIEIEQPIIEEIEYPEELKIGWENIFEINDNDYFVYVYSPRCFYCNQIKDDVVEFSRLCLIGFYFVEYSDVVKKSDNIEKTIGADKLEDTFVKGVPSLIRIKSGVIIQNVAGSKEIMNIISNS